MTKKNFIAGFGLGLMIPIGYATFNSYFVKRRVFAMSASQAMRGIIITSHPMLVKILMNEYGFRGTVAMIAAVNAHAILGMLVMHPVEWHYRVIKVPQDELESRKFFALPSRVQSSVLPDTFRCSKIKFVASLSTSLYVAVTGRKFFVKNAALFNICHST